MVRFKVLKSQEVDEPLDVMLYMIIVALGFAALENIIYILGTPVLEAFKISIFRFVGAVFLHTLASGVLGYFLALSFFEPQKKTRLLAFGFGGAVILHGILNYLIIRLGDSIALINGSVALVNPGLFNFCFFGLIFALLFSAIFVTLGFKKLKKLKGVCKIS